MNRLSRTASAVVSCPWLILALRLYIGYVFLAACFHKIVHPEMFAVDVATYQILPLYLINLMAIVLPWIELVAALMLILGLRHWPGERGSAL